MFLDSREQNLEQIHILRDEDGDRRDYGGIRYALVVRYNKVHVYMVPEDIREAVHYLEIKEVESGANMGFTL